MFKWVEVKGNNLPLEKGEVIGYCREWIHPDFNPDGTRVCFATDNGWISSKWCDYHDTYENGEEIPPTHYIEIPKFTKYPLKEIFHKLFQEIKHGDQEHQDWLEEKMKTFLEEYNGDFEEKIKFVTLTRSQLLEAKNAYGCEKWINNIQEILDSTIDESIEIQDKYLNLIKEEATWIQIKYCEALNLDLKMNLPEEAKEWILEKIKSCEVLKYGEFITYYKEKENVYCIFYFDSKTKEFWFEYSEIYKVLEEKYSLKYNEMREIMVMVLKNHLKLEGYIVKYFYLSS